jgi:ligand-binding sensor domain-containing protein
MKNNLQKLLASFVGLLISGALFAESWTWHHNFTQVTSMAMRNGNEIWIAAKGGLLMYQPSGGQKQFFKPGPDALPSFDVERVMVHPQTNDIWIGTYDNGIAVLNNSGWTHFPFPDPAAILYEMKIAANGDIWAATSAGLYRYANSQFETYFSTANPSNPKIWDFDLMTNGNLLLASESPIVFDPLSLQIQAIPCSLVAYGDATVSIKNDSVFYFSAERGSVVEFLHQSQKSIIRTNVMVKDYVFNEQGDWFLFENRTIQKLSSGSFTNLSLPGAFPTAMMATSDELWIGTGTEYRRLTAYGRPAGLLQVSANGQINETDLRQSAINGSMLIGISHMTSENYVYLSFTDGIQRWNKQSKQFQDDFSLNNQGVVFRTKAMELNGKVYVGSTRGLVAFNSDGTSVILGENLLAYPEISCLTKDNQGNLWMGGMGFIAKYDGSNFQIFGENDHPSLKLSCSITDIFYDSYREQIWASSTDGIFTILSGTIGFHDEYAADPQMLYNGAYSIAEDGDHNIWFSSYSHLVKFDGTGFSLLPVEPSSFNKGIQFDEMSLYMSNWKKGLLKYENGVWDSLSFSNSLIGTNKLRSLYIDEESNVWMGHDYGLIIYNRNSEVLSVSGLQNEMGSVIFPNPAKGVFTISTASEHTHAALAVYSLSGQLVYQSVFNGKSKTVDLGLQSPGVYIYKLKSSSGTATGRLILE